jgi:lipoprotein-releasing system permease protein
MFSSYIWLMAWRYSKAKRRNRFISVIGAISLTGIALGVAALIVVMSVMNGFEKELRERILSAAAHAIITGVDFRMLHWQQIENTLLAHPDVQAIAPYIEREGMINATDTVRGVLLRGIIPHAENQVAGVNKVMKNSALEDLRPGDFSIVIGQELADALQVTIGDKVTVISPETSVTAIGITPRLRRFTVIGIFEFGMHLYDSGVAYLHLEDAQKLFRYAPEEVTGIRLKLKDMMQAPTVVRELALSLGGAWRISDWTKQHSNFFKAIQMEKTVMFVILTLIVAVAAFNIISSLVMSVTEKQADIAILRTMGALPREIMAIFLVQGAYIGASGTLIGSGIGILLAVNVEHIVPFIEKLFQTEFLPGDVYYLSELPSVLVPEDVLRIVLLSLGISLLATLFPAWQAARVQPAEALRYDG